MKQIRLTKGKFTRVSDSWFRFLNQWNWCAQRCGLYFYAARRDAEGRMVLMHRVITSAKPGEVIDHRDLDGLNNQCRNLRRASHSQNHGNANKLRGNYTSQFKGVCWSAVNLTNPWLAYITFNSQRTYLGYHPTPERAAKAYNRAAARLFGRFARVNKL